MKILIVEDERDVADLLQRTLEELGNEVMLAADADAASRALEGGEVDALTLDLGLPDAEGIEWLESIAATRPDLARRTLVITGQMLETDNVTRVARCGAGMLAKPFTIKALADAVRTQLAHRAPGDSEISERN